MSRLIVCITGMPGAGKSTVAKAFKDSCFKVLSMGDVIRKEAERQGLEPNDKNLGEIMLRLRARHGKGAVAYLIADEIKDDDKHVIIDGLRSIEEVKVLKGYGVVKILAIHAPKEDRFRFLKGRGRKDAPKSIEEFIARDKRELEVGLGEAIAYADSIIMNDSSIEELLKKADDIINRWKREVEDGGYSDC